MRVIGLALFSLTAIQLGCAPSDRINETLLKSQITAAKNEAEDARRRQATTQAELVKVRQENEELRKQNAELQRQLTGRK